MIVRKKDVILLSSGDSGNNLRLKLTNEASSFLIKHRLFMLSALTWVAFT